MNFSFKDCNNTARLDAVAMITSIVLALCFLTSCATPARQAEQSWNRPPTPIEVAKWREKNGLSVASESEIAESKKRESVFDSGRAVSPFGGLRVAFQCGSLVGSGHKINLSTTSFYILQDTKGRELASGPACMTKADSAVQRAWFSPDGKQALVFEYVRECNGPPPLTILFHEDSENPGLWHTRFLELPDFLNIPFDEGAHSECRGFFGDELLIDATTDGTVSKKKIRDLKERYPFPFTIG